MDIIWNAIKSLVSRARPKKLGWENRVEIYGNGSKYVIIISMVMTKQFLRIQDDHQTNRLLSGASCHLSNLIGATQLISVTPIFFYTVFPDSLPVSLVHKTIKGLTMFFQPSFSRFNKFITTELCKQITSLIVHRNISGGIFF